MARTRGLSGWKAVAACVVVSAACTGAGTAASANARRAVANAAHVVSAVPLVLSASAAPPALGSHGGTVTVHGRVKNAVSCRLELLSQQSFPVVYARNLRPCKTSLSAHVTVGANPTFVSRTVAFALVARDKADSYTGRFYVSLAPRVAPAGTAAVFVSVNPSTLPSSGGQATVTYTSRNALTCHLKSAALSTSPEVVPCNGSHVVNLPPTHHAHSYVFTFTGNGGSGAAATATAELTQRASLSTMTPTTTTVATGSTTRTAPPSPNTTTPSVTTATVPVLGSSPNWSGYVASGGGPFTEVMGTFTVPYIATAANCEDALSEWVGLDGVGNGELIQAGVSESMQDPSTGACTQGEFYASPWWEILPAPSARFYAVRVRAGDSVTVGIWQLSRGEWEISMTDNSDGESASVDEAYDGPLSSAEWVTEASASPYCADAGLGSMNGHYVCPLAPYSPAVQFSGMRISGANTSMQPVTMEQNGEYVSVPSGYSAGAFSTTYTGITEASLWPSLAAGHKRLSFRLAPAGKYRPTYDSRMRGSPTVRKGNRAATVVFDSASRSM